MISKIPLIHPTEIQTKTEESTLVDIKTTTNLNEDVSTEFAGINGVILLDSNKKIVCSYFPARPGSTSLEGENYTGSKFAEDIFNRKRDMEIFLVTRPEEAGGPGVEVTVALRDHSARLAYRLDMELIKLKYGCDINGLAKSINP